MVCSCSTVPGGFEQWYVLNIPASKPQKRHGAPGAGWQSEEAQGWEQSSLPLVIHCDLHGTTKNLFLPSLPEACFHLMKEKLCIDSSAVHQDHSRSLLQGFTAFPWLPPQPEATSQHLHFFVSPHVSCYRDSGQSCPVAGVLWAAR